MCVCVVLVKLPDDCYLRESDGQAGWLGTAEPFEVVFSPEKFDPPRENLSCCSTFLVPVWWRRRRGELGLREGYLFLFAADKSIHTLRYSRPAKVKKSV